MSEASHRKLPEADIRLALAKIIKFLAGNDKT